MAGHTVLLNMAGGVCLLLFAVRMVRIGVMRAGRLTHVFQRGGWSQDALLAAAFGESAPPAPKSSPETADAL